MLISVVQASGPSLPTGSVTFSSGATVFGTATVGTNGLATISVAPQQGVFNITATYSGDSLYATSASPTVLVTVGPPVEFALSMQPPSLTLKSGDHGTIQISIATAATFKDTVAFGCAGLPASATCTFSNDKMAVGGGSTSNLSVIVDTGNPLGVGATAKLDQPGRSSNLTLAFLPAAALLLCIGRPPVLRRTSPQAARKRPQAARSAHRPPHARRGRHPLRLRKHLQHDRHSSRQLHLPDRWNRPEHRRNPGRHRNPHGQVTRAKAQAINMTSKLTLTLIPAVAALAGSISPAARAQASYAGIGPGSYVSVGATFSGYNSGQYGKTLLTGGSAFVDANLYRRIGVEAEYRKLNHGGHGGHPGDQLSRRSQDLLQAPAASGPTSSC